LVRSRGDSVPVRRDEEDIPAFEVSAGGHAIVRHERGRIGAEDGVDLLVGPDVEFALVTFAVGVERGVEPAFRRRHLATDPFAGLDRNAANLFVLRRLPEVRAESGEEGVVVEHLLEMGDEPARIDRVARESATDLIVDATARHFAE